MRNINNTYPYRIQFDLFVLWHIKFSVLFNHILFAKNDLFGLLYDINCSYLTLIILLNYNHLFAHSYMVSYSCLIQIIFKQIYLTDRWDPTTPSQSGPGSNDNEGLLHTPKIFRTGASLLDAVWFYAQESPFLFKRIQ